MAKILVMPLICETRECMETKGVKRRVCEHLACPEHTDEVSGACWECIEEAVALIADQERVKAALAVVAAKEMKREERDLHL